MKKRSLFSPDVLYYGLLTLALYLPILMLVVFSFNDSQSMRFPLSGFTLRWYEELWQAGELLDSLGNSVVVGLLSSLVAVVLGTMAAIAIMRFDFPGKSAFLAVSALPMVIPAGVIGVAR